MSEHQIRPRTLERIPKDEIQSTIDGFARDGWEVLKRVDHQDGSATITFTPARILERIPKDEIQSTIDGFARDGWEVLKRVDHQDGSATITFGDWIIGTSLAFGAFVLGRSGCKSGMAKV